MRLFESSGELTWAEEKGEVDLSAVTKSLTTIVRKSASDTGGENLSPLMWIEHSPSDIGCKFTSQSMLTQIIGSNKQGS